MQPHDSLIVSLAPSGLAWLGLAFMLLVGAITFIAAGMLHDGEEAIAAAHGAQHDMAYRTAVAGSGEVDDPAFDYDPELVRLAEASETAAAPGGYMNWHEYDMWHRRPVAFTAEWWLLMRRLTYEDTQLHRSCGGYIHHHVTCDESGGYILRASYHAAMQSVA